MSNTGFPLTLLQAQAELAWLIGEPTDAEIEARTDAEWSAMDDRVADWLHRTAPGDPDPALTGRIKTAAFDDWIASNFAPDPYLANCTACGEPVTRWRTEAPSPSLCPRCLQSALHRAFPGIEWDRRAVK
jgi:hypothetical protein